MDWSDQPAGQPAHSPPEGSPFAAPGSHSPTASASPAPTRSRLEGARRTIATALLAGGLLTVGGVAVVFAADPSATPAPSAAAPSTQGGGIAPDAGTTRPQRGGGPAGVAPDGTKVDCPDKVGAGGGTTTPSPDASTAPTTPTPDPTVTPDPTATPSAEL